MNPAQKKKKIAQLRKIKALVGLTVRETILRSGKRGPRAVCFQIARTPRDANGSEAAQEDLGLHSPPRT